jgi:hypothetical protein
VGTLYCILWRVAASALFVPMAHVALKTLGKVGYTDAGRQDPPLATVWALALDPLDLLKIAFDPAWHH